MPRVRGVCVCPAYTMRVYARVHRVACSAAYGTYMRGSRAPTPQVRNPGPGSRPRRSYTLADTRIPVAYPGELRTLVKVDSQGSGQLGYLRSSPVNGAHFLLN